MLKTIREYLQEIPDPVIRAQALANLWVEYGNEWSTSLDKALKRAFLWHRSPEKYVYWKKAHHLLTTGEILAE